MNREILIDTQALVWARQDTDLLSKGALKALAHMKHDLYFSVASIWELAIKIKLKKIEMKISLDEFVSTATSHLGINILPIESAHALYIERLAEHATHKDPFDRLIAAQALYEGMSVISADKSFDLYSVDRIW